jgi:hypothetical protein
MEGFSDEMLQCSLLPSQSKSDFASYGEVNLSDFMLRPFTSLGPGWILIHFGARSRLCSRGQSVVSDIAF